MKELDFLFLYEHKVRELENLCLIKYELDKRGYKTEIRYIEDARNALAVKPQIHAKVLCVMACYNDQTLNWQAKEFVTFDKIIDMQWENIVYPGDEKRKGAYKNYSGIGKEAVRVSWGKQNEKRMLDVVKMDPRKLKVIGHVGMDFLREPLNRYYLSRTELFEKYQIPQDEEVVLFASPYYGDCLEESYIQEMCMRFGQNWADYYEFMCRSQEIVLSWMEQILKKDDNICFVFRPHPGHPSRSAERLAEKYQNFKIISGESVKQWIVTCDKVYTGNSSVIVEAFFAKKMCQLLFPLPITEGYKLALLDHSTEITSYEGFEKSIYAKEEAFPIPKENIEEIYLIDFEEPSYVKFADMAQEVLREDYYRISKEALRVYKPHYTGLTAVSKAVSRCGAVHGLYMKLIDNQKLTWPILEKQRKKRAHVYEIEKEHENELTSEKEIAEIIKRIKNACEA